MPMNRFASQQEVIFITYEDVIKSPKVEVLKRLLDNNYKSSYKDFIDYSKIENKTDDELLTMIMGATKTNILEYLSLNPFDYDVTYLDLYLGYDSYIIKNSKLLDIGKAVHILLKQKFLKRIYIYSKYYDKYIHDDIVNLYGTTNVTYVYGDLKETISEVYKDEGITSYILNDIEILPYLIDNNMISYTSVLLANCGWNYTVNKDNIPVLKVENIDSLSEKHIFKISMFTPVSISNGK